MVKIYSHSRLGTFEHCPLKFKYQYIDKIEPEIKKTIESHLGKVIHNTLEWLYNQIKENKIPTIDELIVYYAKNWKENYTSEIIIIKQEMTTQDYFNKGIQFLLDYYKEHYPFDDNTLETEKEILIDLDETGEYKIRGFIDRLTYNLKTGEYEIHDYKTSNNIPMQEQIENDRQLALYSIAVKELFGEDKDVLLIWHYLAHNKRIQSKRTNEQLKQLKKETLELIKKIESTTEFPPKVSTLCNWCEYKLMCHAWENKPSKKGRLT